MSESENVDENRLASLLPVVDFKGVKFRDISPLLMDWKMLECVVHKIAKQFKDQRIDVVAGVEARGFLFGPMIANILEAGFVPIRKPSKLPGKVLQHSYTKEYGTDTIEMPDGLLQEDCRVLIVDDILATGGTIIAAYSLLRSAKAIPVGCAVVGEIASLKGREKIESECTLTEMFCEMIDGFPCCCGKIVSIDVFTCISF